MSRSLMPLSLLETVDAVKDVNSWLSICRQICKLPRIFLVISMFLLMSTGRISLAEPFATADFDGIWNLHGLISGADFLRQRGKQFIFPLDLVIEVVVRVNYEGV